MTNEDAQRVILALTAFVLALRWINGVRQNDVPKHKIWTFGLSLSAWFVLYIRLSITRNFDLIAPFDPLATVSFGYVLVAQSIGFAYEWAPRRLRRRFAEWRSR